MPIATIDEYQERIEEALGARGDVEDGLARVRKSGRRNLITALEAIERDLNAFAGTLEEDGETVPEQADNFRKLADIAGEASALLPLYIELGDYAPGGKRFVEPFDALRHELVDRVGERLIVHAYPSGEIELRTEGGAVVLELPKPKEG
jgi:hypothetical protein